MRKYAKSEAAIFCFRPESKAYVIFASMRDSSLGKSSVDLCTVVMHINLTNRNIFAFIYPTTVILVL